jgi:hypothetical protein
MWRFITPCLRGSDRIVLCDHVGHGQSDATAFDREKYACLDGYAEDVLAICRALDLRDIVFVGHPVSAMIGRLQPSGSQSVSTSRADRPLAAPRTGRGSARSSSA